ncbi:hypothetical protein AAFF_G00239730 [Aldrovandia affinis]|uniref:Uncharacterized protein n=1 Tax=Aldrovandia affinis TaxID=143900 RepID=A0AAD7SVJ0_9TELE|nr:hypothetical protein AAFF_G00239730 [Aldrovandia affinis]
MQSDSVPQFSQVAHGDGVGRSPGPDVIRMRSRGRRRSRSQTSDDDGGQSCDFTGAPSVCTVIPSALTVTLVHRSEKQTPPPPQASCGDAYHRRPGPGAGLSDPLRRWLPCVAPSARLRTSLPFSFSLTDYFTSQGRDSSRASRFHWTARSFDQGGAGLSGIHTAQCDKPTVRRSGL